MRHVFAALLLVLILSPAALAVQIQPDQSRHELSGSSRSSFSVTNTFEAPLFSLSAGYAYRLNKDWQLSASLSIGAGSGFTSLSAAVGPTINFFTFENTLSSAFYLRPFVAGSYSSEGSPRYFGSFGAVIGKRFEITKAVVWKPELAIEDVPAFESGFLTLNIFQLAVLLD